MHNLPHPGSQDAWKWRENEKKKRKLRENEEMERDLLSTFPHFLFILPLYSFPISKMVSFCRKIRHFWEKLWGPVSIYINWIFILWLSNTTLDFTFHVCLASTLTVGPGYTQDLTHNICFQVYKHSTFQNLILYFPNVSYRHLLLPIWRIKGVT